MGRTDDETIREAGPITQSRRRQITRLHLMGRGLFESRELPETARWVIGRGADCELRLDDQAVSRRHAILHVGESIQVEDAGSANGTIIRGKRLAPGETTEAFAGDAIEIGGFTLTLAADPETERTRKIWPHGYFEACLETECARADRDGGKLEIVRVRTNRPIDAVAAAKVLGGDLRSDEVIAEYGPGEYELLLIGRDPELSSTIKRAITARLTDLGVEPRLATSEHPRDGRTAPELIARVSEAVRGVDPGARTEPLVIVEDPSMQRLHRLIERIASGSISVLILGETGVGKEVTAETIHQKSPRKDGPFVKLNCAALSESLIESELFGHEKGAFTGALRAKPGLLETAEGGTLFLDEVGELPLSLQVKLLRVLEERQVLRVGGLKPVAIDVRLVSATNRDLEAEIEAGRFRQDLFFRLNGIALTVPPLRERTSEIKSLASSFIRRVCAQDRRSTAPALSPEALKVLEGYRWPGNIRELKNVIERAVLLAGDEPITPQHLPLDKMAPPVRAASETDSGRIEDTTTDSGDKLVDQLQAFERDRIVRALEQCGGNQTQAAKLLGIARRTLINRLEQYQIERPRKRSSED